MRTSPMLEFPLQEFESRLERLTKGLKKAGLDGIMLTSKENTRYFSGLQSIIWSSKVSTPGILIVSADGKSRMVGSASASETAMYTSCIDEEDVKCFNRNFLSGIPGTYPDAIIESFHDLNLDHGRIGMEFGKGCYFHLQQHWFEEILGRMSIQTVDASDLIWEIRSIKSEAEIALLKEVCLLNERSVDFAFRHTELNRTTEADFFRMYAQEAFRGACENVHPLSVRFGKNRFHYPNCPFSDGVVISADPHAALLVSGGLFKKGYFADTVRTGIVMGLDQTQELLSKVSTDVQAYAVSKICPGVRISEVVETIDAYAESQQGFAYYGGCNGHSIGLDIREYPLFNRKDDTILMPGMVISFEIAYGNADTGLFCNEIPVAVTETGCSVLGGAYTGPYILK